MTPQTAESAPSASSAYGDGAPKSMISSLPVSLARLNANTANAKLSTGPRTAAGLNRSSQNALRHGFSATSTVVIKGVEDAAEYENLAALIVEDLDARGPVETLLAVRVAQLAWRLERVVRLETQRLAQWQDGLLPGFGHLNAMLKIRARRDEVLAALGMLFLPESAALPHDTVSLIFEACQEMLSEGDRLLFLGRHTDMVAAYMAQSQSAPYTVGSVAGFLNSAAACFKRNAYSQCSGPDAGNFIAWVFQNYASRERESDAQRQVMKRDLERQHTEALLLQLAQAGVIDRYEPRLRRDLSRTLADLFALQARRRTRVSLSVDLPQFVGIAKRTHAGEDEFIGADSS